MGALVRFGSGAIHPPSLAECLSCVRDHDLPVNVEIKSQRGRVDEATRVVVAELYAAGMRDSTIVSSFDFEVLRVVRHLSADVATAALTSSPMPDPVDGLEALDADAYHPEESVLLRQEAVWTADGRQAVEAVRGSRRGVNVWTANADDLVRALAGSMVTGIISEHPDQVLASISAPPRLPSPDPSR